MFHIHNFVSAFSGAYALGSGALGYSERRSNPRRSFKAPLLPPVRAAPNLIPAAVNSPEPVQAISVLNYSGQKASGKLDRSDIYMLHILLVVLKFILIFYFDSAYFVIIPCD